MSRCRVFLPNLIVSFNHSFLAVTYCIILMYHYYCIPSLYHMCCLPLLYHICFIILLYITPIKIIPQHITLIKRSLNVSFLSHYPLMYHSRLVIPQCITHIPSTLDVCCIILLLINHPYRCSLIVFHIVPAVPIVSLFTSCSLLYHSVSLPSLAVSGFESLICCITDVRVLMISVLHYYLLNLDDS